MGKSKLGVSGGALALMMSVGPASADEPVTHDRFTKWTASGERLMALVSASKLQPEQDLDAETGAVTTLRDTVAKLQAHESTLSPADQKAAKVYEARVLAWAANEDTVLATEETGRSDIAVPLCDAVNSLAELKAELAREKANPSGVVDLNELHRIGGEMQVVQDRIKELSPPYIAFRHHAFTTWDSEGACVAENNKRQGGQ